MVHFYSVTSKIAVEILRSDFLYFFVLKNFRQGFNIKLTLQIYCNNLEKSRKKTDGIPLKITQINNVFVSCPVMLLQNQFNRNISTNFNISLNRLTAEMYKIFTFIIYFSSLNKYRFRTTYRIQRSFGFVN